jgi:glycosyltransferase involved in cell wall biosynthesis
MKSNKTQKIAIVHDWLVNFGGAERVVQQLLALYPDADIYTLVYDKKKMDKYFPSNKVHVSSLQRLPFATRIYTKLLKFMPHAFEEFDFSKYDLVIASSSSCAKGVITPPSVPLIAYIHSPMRYAWDLYPQYLKNSNPVTRHFMKKWMPSIREWDYISSQRIDTVIANSNYIARRIKKYWNRDSVVVYPPVDTDRLIPSTKPAQDFYVVFSRFVAYKRIDIAIEACGKLQRNLVVIGSGSEESKLKKLAKKYSNNKSTIQFTGRISDKDVSDYLCKCKALLFCAEEDFGIIPVEAQACGKPVIAFGKGGALETVINEKTGLFFNEQTAQSLSDAILLFESLDLKSTFDKKIICANAKRFSTSVFAKQINAIVTRTCREFKK